MTVKYNHVTKPPYILALLLGLSVAGTAHAGFRVDTPEYRPTVHPGSHAEHIGVPDNYVLISNKQLKYVETIGPVTSTPVAGFGDGIPLDAAMEMLLPAGWLAYTNPDVVRTLPVSWKEGQTWMDALRGIAIRSGLQFYVDFNNSVVRIDRMPDDSALVAMSDYDYVPVDSDSVIALEDSGMSYPVGQTPADPLSLTSDANASPHAGVLPYDAAGDANAFDVPNTEPSEPSRPSGSSTPTTLREFYNEMIVLNIVDQSVESAIKDIAPMGWGVVMEVGTDYFGDRKIARLTAERPRGQVIAKLQTQLDIAIIPYPIQNLIVVTEH